MRRIALFGALVLSFTFAVGCNNSEPPAEQAAAPAPAEPAPPPPPPPSTVAREFLQAVQKGDDKTAESLLTDLARQKTREMDFVVAPPGSPTATFEVGATEFAANGQLAYVESRWTDVGVDGKPEINEFVWAMRLDKAGWRIGGVVTQQFTDGPYLELNFEDPEDMIRKTELADQEMQKRSGGATVAAGSTTNSTAATPAGYSQPASTTTGNATSAPPLTPPPGMLPPAAVQNATGMPASRPLPGTLPPVSPYGNAVSPPMVPPQAQQTPPGTGVR